MKLWASLIPIALIACGGDDPIVLDLDTDSEPLPAALDFEAGDVTRVVVETVNGSVSLNPGDSEGGVSVDLLPVEPSESWDYFLQDRVLAMWPLCGNGVIGCSSGFALGLPTSMRVDVKTVSGQVTITDRGGEVYIESTQGVVTGEGLTGGDLVVDGQSAILNIAYAQEPGSVSLTTESGGITLDVPRGTYAMDVTTNGVKSIIDVMEGDGPSITILSTSGDVTIRGI